MILQALFNIYKNISINFDKTRRTVLFALSYFFIYIYSPAKRLTEYTASPDVFCSGVLFIKKYKAEPDQVRLDTPVGT